LPVEVFKIILPTPPLGLVDIVGSVDCFVISAGKLVKLLPSPTIGLLNVIFPVPSGVVTVSTFIVDAILSS
jgi:hypothetical protein